jgi:hypothetical protein
MREQYLGLLRKSVQPQSLTAAFYLSHFFSFSAVACGSGLIKESNTLVILTPHGDPVNCHALSPVSQKVDSPVS